MISICQEISTDNNFKNIYELLTKKSRANDIDNYIKGPDTWIRRIGTATVAQITHLVESKVDSENIEQIDNENVTDEVIQDCDTNISENLMTTKNDRINDETKSDVSKTSSVKSQAISQVTQAKSRVSQARSHVSEAKTDMSEAECSLSTSDKNDFHKIGASDSFEIESAETNSVVSHTSTYVSQTKSDTSQAKSNFSKQSIISHNSDTKSVVSGTKSTTSKISTKTKTRDTTLDTIKEHTIDLKNAGSINEQSEDEINIWYQNNLAELNTKSLRDEQYRRKKAMLRVEYWTKMDKLKNNATPTIINQ